MYSRIKTLLVALKCSWCVRWCRQMFLLEWFLIFDNLSHGRVPQPGESFLNLDPRIISLSDCDTVTVGESRRIKCLAADHMIVCRCTDRTCDLSVRKKTSRTPGLPAEQCSSFIASVTVVFVRLCDRAGMRCDRAWHIEVLLTCCRPCVRLTATQSHYDLSDIMWEQLFGFCA